MSTSSSAGRSATLTQDAPGVLGNRWLILWIVSIAKFMVGLDATIVNVALPSIQSDLGMSQAELQWVVNAYALVFGGFLMLAGRLSDRLGQKQVFMAGVALFTVASAVNGFAPNGWMLIVGRGVQGLGGALISPAALSILTTAFGHDPKERTKALSVWAALVAGGTATGLLVGGALTDTLSWRWNFFINLPLGIAALIVGIRTPMGAAGRKVGGFDVTGAIAVTAGLVMAIYVLVNGETWGWSSPTTLAWAAAAIVVLGFFVLVESRSSSPLMRLGILRIRTLAVADVVLIFLTSGIFTMFFFSALYLQGPLGYSPLQGGLAFLPAAIGVMAGSTFSQRLVAWFGHLAVGTFGLGLSAVGMALLSRLPVHGSYVVHLLPGLMCLSLGLGISFVPLTFLATSVPPAEAGLASGLYQTVQQLGGPLGLAILSALAVQRAGHVLAGTDGGPAAQATAEVAGFRVAFLGGAILLAIGTIVYRGLLRKRDIDALMTKPEPAAA